MSHRVLKLDDLCSLITKGTTPTSIGRDYSDTGILFVRVQNLVGGTVSFKEDDLKIDQLTHEVLKRSQIRPGDVLVSIAGTIGRAAIVPKNAPDMNCNQAVAIIRPRETLCRRFLLHWLSSDLAIEQIRKTQVTATISNLSLSQLGALEIPLPPLPEQKRIAAILDQADELRRKRQRAIDRLNQLGQAIFYEMFGDRLTQKNKKCSLEEVSSRVTKGESPGWQGHTYTDVGSLFVTSENVGWGRLLIKEPKFVPLAFHEKLARSKLLKGDLLFNLVGASIGRACIYESNFEAANINQAVAVVSLQNDFSNLKTYLLTLALSPFGQAQLLGSRVEGARANISLQDIRRFEFYLPNATEISRFNNAFSNLQEASARMSKSTLCAQDLFHSLQHRAFTGTL